MNIPAGETIWKKRDSKNEKYIFVQCGPKPNSVWLIACHYGRTDLLGLNMRALYMYAYQFNTGWWRTEREQRYPVAHLIRRRHCKLVLMKWDFCTKRVWNSQFTEIAVLCCSRVCFVLVGWCAKLRRFVTRTLRAVCLVSER